MIFMQMIHQGLKWQTNQSSLVCSLSKILFQNKLGWSELVIAICADGRINCCHELGLKIKCKIFFKYF